jgi:plasmid stability protein
MPNRQRNYEEELNNLMEGVAEYTLDMSDDEIRDEIREEGGDPDKAAEETRDILRKAVKAFRQRKLNEAQALYEEQVASFSKKKYSLPDSMEEQRNLLMNVLASNSQMRSAVLTAQNREFKDLPDSEVTSYLKQLQALGVLDEISPGGDEET